MVAVATSSYECCHLKKTFSSSFVMLIRCVSVASIVITWLSQTMGQWHLGIAKAVPAHCI